MSILPLPSNHQSPAGDFSSGEKVRGKVHLPPISKFSLDVERAEGGIQESSATGGFNRQESSFSGGVGIVTLGQ